MKKHLIYISLPGSTVFESQVLTLLKQVKKENFFTKVTLFLGLKKDSNWEKVNEKASRFNLNIVKFKAYPNYFFYERLQKMAIGIVLKKHLRNNSIIHVRGESFSLALRSAIKQFSYSNVYIISDVRGASYEETLLYKKMLPGLLQIKLYQHKRNIKLLSKSSDYISCVSKKLKEYIIERSDIASNKIYVNHCIAGHEFFYSSENRKTYREKLNLKEDDVLFLFITGANREWQNTEDIILGIASKGYKVLNLSRKKILDPNVINMFVPYKDVPNYINAADIGVIWRDLDMVNKVASPIKFSEYVSCGLPIIASYGVDLVNLYVKETNFGKLIKSFDEIYPEDIIRLKELNREKISSYAKEVFSLDKISNQYLSLYKKAFEERSNFD